MSVPCSSSTYHTTAYDSTTYLVHIGLQRKDHTNTTSEQPIPYIRHSKGSLDLNCSQDCLDLVYGRL